MSFERISIIVPLSLLDTLEKYLRASGVPGMTVDEVRGFGEHANFFSRDLMRSNFRVEVYLDADRVQAVIGDAVGFARDQHAAAGILAVESVERMVNLNNGEPIMSMDSPHAGHGN